MMDRYLQDEVERSKAQIMEVDGRLHNSAQGLSELKCMVSSLELNPKQFAKSKREKNSR